MNKSSPAKIRRINNAKKQAGSAPSTTPRVPTAAPLLPREFLEILERRLYGIEQVILNLQQALVTTDARGWVTHYLLEDVVKGEVKDLNELRERLKDLSNRYTERFNEERQKAENPPVQQGGIASPAEEVVLGG